MEVKHPPKVYLYFKGGANRPLNQSRKLLFFPTLICFELLGILISAVGGVEEDFSIGNMTYTGEFKLRDAE